MQNTKTTGWIQTHTGRQFFPLEPEEGDINIVDIAHALAQQCRFSGHTSVFYSIAEHSVRAAGLLPAPLALWGLLHDASEAYLVDIPRPLKCMPEFAGYREAEARLQSMIYRKYGLIGDPPPELKAADDTLVLTEGRDLLGLQVAPWGIAGRPLAEPILYPWTPDEAEGAFDRVFSELMREHTDV